MRKPIMLSSRWNSVQAIIGPRTKAWIYGSVARGTARDDSDIDIYIAGPGAEIIERRYFIEHPLVEHNGHLYKAHIIGPSMVSESDFLSAQSEAIKIIQLSIGD